MTLDIIDNAIVQASRNELGVIRITNRGWHEDPSILNELAIGSKPPLDRRRPGLFKTNMNKGGALHHHSTIRQPEDDPKPAS
jgi:hypothetical protein